jgi:hypothetical protein
MLQLATRGLPPPVAPDDPLHTSPPPSVLVRSLLAHSPLLEELDLGGCERLTPDSLATAIHPGGDCTAGIHRRAADCIWVCLQRRHTGIRCLAGPAPPRSLLPAHAAVPLRHVLLARSGACCDEAVEFLVDRWGARGGVCGVGCWG